MVFIQFVLCTSKILQFSEASNITKIQNVFLIIAPSKFSKHL